MWRVGFFVLGVVTTIGAAGFHLGAALESCYLEHGRPCTITIELKDQPHD